MENNIIITRDNAEKYLDEIILETDKHKNEFGFLPFSAYKAFADKKNIYVALVKDKYAGHILVNTPNGTEAKIRQTYCKTEYRKEGIASKLIETLIKDLEKKNYLSVTARIASELEVANHFYKKHGFHLIKTVEGGKVKKRSINIRCKSLDTNNLFSNDPLWVQQAETIPTFDIVSTTSLKKTEKFILDVNVILDACNTDREAHYDASYILCSALSHKFKIYITHECKKELARHERENDPLLAFTKTAPLLNYKNQQKYEENTNSILKIIFNKTSFSDREVSDAKHLAIAVDNRVDGFITRDEKIIKASKKLRERYNISVIHPDDIVRSYENEMVIPTYLYSEKQSILIEDDITQYHDIISSRLADTNHRQDINSGIIIKEDNIIVTILLYEQINKFTYNLFLIILDNVADISAIAIELAINKFIDSITDKLPVIIDLTIIATADLRLTMLLKELGFQKKGEQRFEKLVIGKILFNDNWASITKQIAENSKLKFASTLPKYTDSRQLIILHDDNKQVNFPYEHYYHYFSPIMLVLPQQKGLIIPIRKQFAEKLLIAPHTLFDGINPVIYSKKIYYIDASRKKIFNQPRQPLLFYESNKDGGKKAIIGIASFRECFPHIDGYYNDRGVLNDKFSAINKIERLQIVIEFDNFIAFRNPISFKQLNEMGIAKPAANFVTVSEIGYHNLIKIIRIGTE
ncbi:MAG: GNAT family N-acetyltransferase [Alphaproteobacteria bacterium]|nr:GNAT family N-acetyltransferase [Alphaproteobacteria bacterium]